MKGAIYIFFLSLLKRVLLLRNKEGVLSIIKDKLNKFFKINKIER